MASQSGFLRYLKLYVRMDLGMALHGDLDLSSSFRGLFGRALKDTFCIQRNSVCANCPFTKCLYRRIFEEEQSGYEQFRPYIIHHVHSNSPDPIIEITLLGTLVDNLSSVVLVILRMLEWKLRLGTELYPINIKEIVDASGKVLYTEGSGVICEVDAMQIAYAPRKVDSVTLQFVTPLRMKNEGKLMSRFEWKGFFRNLYKRVSFIDEHFNDHLLCLEPLWEDELRFQADMIWEERERRSYRQMQKMSLGGLLGTVILQDPMPQTVGILELGEICHAGKQCTFGLGKYFLK